MSRFHRTENPHRRPLFPPPLRQRAFEDFFPGVVYGPMGFPGGSVQENGRDKVVNMSRIVLISTLVFTLLAVSGWAASPGWMPLFGPKAVMDSWRRIIANTAEIHFTLTGAQALICGEIGVVTVFESIQNVPGDERTTSGTFATNLFAYEKNQARWMLFHHHASHAAFPHEIEEGTLLV